MSEMADVLAKHQDLAWNHEKGKAVCGGCDETLGPMTAYIEKQYTWLVTHQSAALSAAGFGLVADAKAEGLEEAAERFKQRSDTYHKTMQEMTASKEYGLEDIVRYGAYSAESNTTATWLRTQASVIRNQS